MVTLASYRLRQVSLPKVTLGGLYVSALGAGLYDLGGQVVLSVVEDNSGRTIVFALTPEQAGQARELIERPFAERVGVVQDWMASADLEDNEVVGWARDYLFLAIKHFAEPDG